MSNGSSSVVTMKALLEAGVHFGHRTRRWNPKMKPYIFTERNGIHIIDLQQTITRLNQAYDVVKDTVASGGIVLFVGTKRQAQDSIVQEATRCGMPYVNQRWLGGTLTNWRTIRQRIEYLLDIEKQQARGEFARLTKKEALMQEREIDRLNFRLGGLKEMRRLPNLLFVVDIRRDSLAVKEANILGIPIIAMVDTNCDPDPIDYVVPSNDDAIRALKLMCSTISSAVLEGQAILSSLRAEEEEVETLEEDQALERYLGPSTLAKIQEAEEQAAAETEEAGPETGEEAAKEEAVAEEAEPAEAEAEPAETKEEAVEEEAVEEKAEPPEAQIEEEAQPEAEAEPAEEKARPEAEAKHPKEAEEPAKEDKAAVAESTEEETPEKA